MILTTITDASFLDPDTNKTIDRKGIGRLLDAIACRSQWRRERQGVKEQGNTGLTTPGELA